MKFFVMVFSCFVCSYSQFYKPAAITGKGYILALTSSVPAAFTAIEWPSKFVGTISPGFCESVQLVRYKATNADTILSSVVGLGVTVQIGYGEKPVFALGGILSIGQLFVSGVYNFPTRKYLIMAGWMYTIPNFVELWKF